jgi:hypothetical protein
MAAYAAVAGLTPIIFLPYGNISFGKLAQALEYGALTLQVEANFDQILALVRVLAERTGIYLLNSMNPFRLEGQKTIMVEMLDQRDWRVPDWVVVPGGNLGNVSAFGKGLRELLAQGLIDRLPKLAVVQADGSAPLYDYFHSAERGEFRPGHGIRRRWPPPFGLAIRFPGPRQCLRLRTPEAPSSESRSRRSPTPRPLSGVAESAASLLPPRPSPG